MDFDLDDPMDSDDSFFEEPKVLNKRSSLTKTPEKKSVESLFSLDDKSKAKKSEVKTAEKKSLENLFGLTDNKSTDKVKPTVKFDETIKKVEFKQTPKNKEVWLTDTDPSSVLDKTTKKTDFLDDILSIKPKTSRPENKASSLDDILKESKLASTSFKPPTPTKEPFTPTESSSDLGMMSTTRERRRRRGSATGFEDALGLFGNDQQSGEFYNKDKSKSADDVHKTKILPDKTSKSMPDWLGVSSVSVKSDQLEITKTEEPIPPLKEETIHPPTMSSTAPLQLDPQNINTSIQNSYSSLHQQESFLIVSLQLKKYEEALAEIKHQQKELMDKQDKQFHSFMDDYVMKQQMVENNIRLQQERINNQIQILLSNPIREKSRDLNQHNIENEKDAEDEEDFKEFIRALKQRHNEEMFIMEESYKKQVTLMESSAISLEQKLKEEMNNITNLFEEKIKNLKMQTFEEIDYYKLKLKSMEEQHQDELKTIKENHSRIIDEIKNEHAIQIEYIKQMKQHETEIMNNGKVYSQKLDNNIQTLSNNTKVLQGMEEKILQSYDVLTMSRENSMQAKEKEIILMRNSLEKCRESAEMERSQLLALVRNLELKLAEQTNNASEDRWALKQATATLTARAAAIERESQYNRSVIERERQELKTLKESLLADQEKMVMQLTEDKLQFSAEKSRWETSSKLTNSYEIERVKAEAESAIQVARELADKVNQERSHLQRQKNEMETLRLSLLDRERTVEEKEVELEMLMQDAQRKLRDDKKVLTEAKKMENMYKERLQELQHQWISLSNREKKLAEDKVSLSRERLSLYTAMKTPKSCVLCKADEKTSLEHFVPSSSQDILIADVEAMKLRMEVLDDESEVSKEENINSYKNLVR